MSRQQRPPHTKQLSPRSTQDTRQSPLHTTRGTRHTTRDAGPSSRRATPVQFRRGAKALVTAGDRVLLVEEAHADGSTFWTLPGGGIEGEESPVTALCRELREELHCRTAVGAHRGRFWYAHASTEKLTRYAVFDCVLLSRPVANGADGILDSQWVPVDELPPETLLPVRHLVENAVAAYTKASK